MKYRGKMKGWRGKFGIYEFPRIHIICKIYEGGDTIFQGGLLLVLYDKFHHKCNTFVKHANVNGIEYLLDLQVFRNQS